MGLAIAHRNKAVSTAASIARKLKNRMSMKSDAAASIQLVAKNSCLRLEVGENPDVCAEFFTLKSR
jgi:hypothetical protein